MKYYFIKFYENGKLCSVMGQPEQEKAKAILRVTSYLLTVRGAGFEVEQDRPDCFTYDRYGTTCTVRIEEE